jgi:hypothetical protein
MTQPTTTPATTSSASTTQRRRTIHAQDPARPTHGICGTKINTTRQPAALLGTYICAVCSDLTRPNYTNR